MKNTLKKAWHSALIIIKLVVPIYIIADILYYYNILSYISFIFEPITSFLELPKEAALAIVSGIFLNLYAAIAFAAPLDMSSFEWSILAIFLGVCHSLLVENAIMKKLGISVMYSYLLRFFGGLIIAKSATFIPKEFFESAKEQTSFVAPSYNSFNELLMHSIYNATILTLKIIVLITILIIVMDFIKNLSFIKNSSKNLSTPFSIFIGLFLGITYGAGVLINEVKSLSKAEIFYIATFLMICHSIIEDTLLFVLFGANFWIVVIIRVIWAIVLAYILTWLYKKFYLKN